jgi:uncharacterized protein YoxC
MTTETRFDTFDQKLDRIAATVEINNGQIARLTEQMIMTDLKIDRMADKVDRMADKVDRMADKVDRMAEKVDRVADAVEQQSKALIAQAQTLLQQAEASKLQAENFSRLLTQLEQRQNGNA